MSSRHERNRGGTHPHNLAALEPRVETPHPALRPLLADPGLAPRQAASRQAGAIQPFQKRFDFELGWLRGLPGITPFAAGVLAARTAASQPAALQHPEAGRAGMLAPLLSPTPDLAALSRVLDVLGAAPPGAPGAEDLACLVSAWPFAVAVEALLASGGDDRLSLDPVTGLNRYLCTPWPRPDVIGFASCTASSLADAPFVAAEHARRQLIRAALAAGPGRALSAASAAAGSAILAHYGVADLAEAVLAASGTDAALIVTGLLAAEQPEVAITSLLMSPAETGSGVPDAVQGRHFAGFAPSGHAVAKGGLVDGLPHTPRLATIALRDQDGAPVAAADLTRACSAAVSAALRDGRVVLHAIDGSKTGLAAPDRPALMRLARRFGASLDIVIDACQGRIEPALVRWYLQQGFPVLVTGSKFFAAPGFCGAVLFPRARLSRIASGGRIACGLAAYARLEGGVGSRQCAGLLLRWTAALHDMATFGGMAEDEVGHRLDTLGERIRGMIRQESRLRLVPAPRPAGMGWSDRSSVFTFTVRDKDGWMDAGRLRQLYLALNGEPAGALPGGAFRCQLGQPVQLGSPALGGLRLALSAAQVSSGDSLAAPLGAVLERLRLLLDRQPEAARQHAGAEPVLATG